MRIFGLLFLAVLLSCNRSTGPHPATGGSSASTGSTDVKANLETSPPKFTPNKHRIAKAGRNIPPIVGGCLILCPTAQKAARNFIGCLHGDLCAPAGSPGPNRSKPAPAHYFINARRLLVSGQPLGDAWHELWLQGKLKERLDKIGEFVDEFGKPLRNIGAKVPIKTLIDEGLTQDEISTSDATFSFVAPGFKSPWRLKFHKRGIEWLIYSLEYRP